MQNFKQTLLQGVACHPMGTSPEESPTPSASSRGTPPAMVPADTEVGLRLQQIIGPGNYLPVSRSTFYKLARSGVFKRVTVPGVRVALWRKSDILALLHADASPSAPSKDGEVRHA